MSSPFDIITDLDSPAAVFAKLQPLRPRCLLESGSGSRYSCIGLGDCDDIRLDAEGLRVGSRRWPRPVDGAGLLTALRNVLAQLPPLEPLDLPLDVRMRGRLFGLASYDMARWFERLPTSHVASVPEAHYLAPRSLLIFDHVIRRMALLHAGSTGERAALRHDIVRALQAPQPRSTGRARVGPVTASMDAAQFQQQVARAQDYIAQGEVYQLVLSIQYSGLCELAPFDVYRALRSLNPAPYMFYCDLGDAVLVGASPEALATLDAGRAQLRPIAGTHPRGIDAIADAQLEAALLEDPKEHAEHVMLVDLARNDLGRVARPGSIRVEPYRRVERCSHVMHLVSGVHGELASDRDAFDLFAAAFPAGTLVGAPKVRAMQLIDELEPVPRGFYAGAVGYFGAGPSCQTMDHAIAIRTLMFREDTYTFQAGAGIVADSVPQREFAEVLAKSEVLRRALASVQEEAP